MVIFTFLDNFYFPGISHFLFLKMHTSWIYSQIFCQSYKITLLTVKHFRSSISSRVCVCILSSPSWSPVPSCFSLDRLLSACCPAGIQKLPFSMKFTSLVSFVEALALLFLGLLTHFNEPHTPVDPKREHLWDEFLRLFIMVILVSHLIEILFG